MNIQIINGPNLNLLGVREPSIYGNKSFDDFFQALQLKFQKSHPQLSLAYYQSNHEGKLIDKIQEIRMDCKGIILNMGALSHTSYAIADAIKAVDIPCIEVHISNIHKRESFRHTTVLTPNCIGMVAGLGLHGYELALLHLLLLQQELL